MSSLRERQRRAVHDELVAAAVNLTDELGADALRIGDVADRAGVSVRTVFRYFRTREDLILAPLVRRDLDFQETFASRPFDESVWHALREAALESIALHAGREDAQAIRAASQALEVNQAVRARFSVLREEMQERLVELISLRPAFGPDRTYEVRLVVSVFTAAVSVAERRVVHFADESPQARLEAVSASLDDVLPALLAAQAVP